MRMQRLGLIVCLALLTSVVCAGERRTGARQAPSTQPTTRRSHDGSIEIVMPAGWKRGGPKSLDMDFRADGKWVRVEQDLKRNYPGLSLRTYAANAASVTAGTEWDVSAPVERLINGFPAVRCEMSRGAHLRFIMFFETQTRFIRVRFESDGGDVEPNRREFESLVRSVKVVEAPPETADTQPAPHE